MIWVDVILERQRKLEQIQDFIALPAAALLFRVRRVEKLVLPFGIVDVLDRTIRFHLEIRIARVSLTEFRNEVFEAD